jgi:hypothetical protein
MAAHAPAADGERTSGKAHRSDLAILCACRNHAGRMLSLFVASCHVDHVMRRRLVLPNATVIPICSLCHAQTCIYADPLRLSLIGIITMFVKANQCWPQLAKGFPAD